MIRFLLLSLSVCLFVAGCAQRKDAYRILVSAEMPAPEIADLIAEIVSDDVSVVHDH